MGSLFSAGVNANSQRNANLTNIRLQEKQLKWNEKMWNKNNAYNTPLAQMQRFAAAGLNPHLIYGQGTSGVSSSPAEGADVPVVRPNWNLDSQMVGQALQLSSQMKVNDSVVEKNIQDASKSRAEANVADANAALLRFNLSRGQSLLPYEQEQFDYNNSILGFNARKQYDRYGREVLSWEAQNSNMWAQTTKLRADTDQVNKSISQMDAYLRNDTIKAIAAQVSAKASAIAANAQRTMADIAGGRLELDWNANTWKSHAQALKNSVTSQEIKNAGALYTKLVAEGRGQEFENELKKRYGNIEKVVGIASSILNTASNVVNSATNLLRGR